MKSKFLKRLFAYGAAIGIIGSYTAALAAVNAEPIASMPAETPEENIFKLENSDKEYILLDMQNDDNSKFLVMAKDYLGTYAFDLEGKQKCDPQSSSNIISKLNNEFVKNGITNKSDGITYMLPPEITNYVDYNHLWQTEGGAAGGGCERDYTIKAGIVLPSQTEIIKYKNKIGLLDGEPYNYAPATGGWLLRTPSASSANQIYVVNTKSKAVISYNASYVQYSARPIFYLNKSFFKENRLSVKSIGSKVAKMLINQYTFDELKTIYTEGELLNYIGYKSMIEVKCNSINGKSDYTYEDLRKAESITINADVCNNTKDDKKMILIAALYDAEGLPVSYSVKSVMSLADSSISEDMLMDVPKNLYGGEYIKITMWEGKNNGLNTVGNSVKIKFN